MIERVAAIEIARERAVANGWAFVEPFAIRYRRGWFGRPDRFDIETNAGKLGAKARFTIDARTGEIVSEGYISR